MYAQLGSYSSYKATMEDFTSIMKLLVEASLFSSSPKARRYELKTLEDKVQFYITNYIAIVVKNTTTGELTAFLICDDDGYVANAVSNKSIKSFLLLIHTLVNVVFENKKIIEFDTPIFKDKKSKLLDSIIEPSKKGNGYKSTKNTGKVIRDIIISYGK